MSNPDTRAQLVATAAEASSNLTTDELADLVNYLGDGDMEGIRQAPWHHHVASALPNDNDADAIHALWVVLINIHSLRSFPSIPR